MSNDQSTGSGGFEIYAKDSVSTIQSTISVAPLNLKTAYNITTTSLGNYIGQYLDSTVFSFYQTGKLRYNLGKDTFSIKGNMGISASSADSVLVRGSDNVVVLRAQSDLGGGLLSGTNTWTAQNTFSRNAVIGSPSTPDATSPLTIDAASTNTAYLLQAGKNGNPAYFRIDKDGNITDIGGGAAPIQSAGGKPYFPSGFAATTWASVANGSSVLRSDWSGAFPWIFYNAASTTDNQIGLIVTGTNATTKGDIQQWADKDFNILSVVNKDGKFGAGVSSPTAYLHPKAGTATAGTAPIKLNTGTALTTPEDGAIEYHGSHIYFTIGSTRYQLDQQSGTNIYNSDGTLTGDRVVSGGGNNLDFTDLGTTQIISTTQSVLQGGSGSTNAAATATPTTAKLYAQLPSGISEIRAYGDSILLMPALGVLVIDSLNQSVVATNKMMVWDSVAKRVATQAAPLSSTYTPTLTNVANVAASTAYSCQYSRVGTVVTVSGEVDIDPTTTLTLTQLGISLPIASNLTATNELGGTSADDLNTAARVAGDATNNRAEIRMTPVDVTNRRFSFTFTYRVL